MVPMPSAFACSDHSPRAAWHRVVTTGLVASSLVALVSVAACTTGPGPNTKAPSSLLKISADDDADVWVDGQYIGQVSAVSGRLELAPGVHRVEVRKAGHFPVQRTVRVDKKGGETLIVSAELLEDPR